VHVFARDGGSHTKRAPENIFHMPDLYTIFDEGRRDLSIENAFGQWEDSFVRVRNLIEAGQEISEEDVGALYVFAGLCWRGHHTGSTLSETSGLTL
jgi:hypothetical protein